MAFVNACRLCLDVKKKLSDIFEASSANLQYSDVVLLVSGTQVSVEVDGMSKRICTSCKNSCNVRLSL